VTGFTPLGKIRTRFDIAIEFVHRARVVAEYRGPLVRAPMTDHQSDLALSLNILPFESQFQLAFIRQYFVGRALNLKQDDAARLANETDNRVGACPLSARAARRMVINLLADFEGVDWSGHPAA
jgi:hypothetical protein